MDHLTAKIRRGQVEIFPKHKFANNWLFSLEDEEEASLAHFVAVVGEKNGMTNNDVFQIFPAILRILKSKSIWAG